jgi:hypothetical protein
VAYSPKCVEGKFSEVHIQHPAKEWAERHSLVEQGQASPQRRPQLLVAVDTNTRLRMRCCGCKRGCSGCVGVRRAGRDPGVFLRSCVTPANWALPKRRRRDSNPRYPVERYNTLAGCRLQPLGHSSSAPEYIKDGWRLRLRTFPILLCSPLRR